MYQNFEYATVDTLEEALTLLNGPQDARPLLGGTDLILQMEKGIVQAGLLVDITQIPELKQIERHGNQITIGAAVTLDEICRQVKVDKGLAALYDACAGVGTPQVRNVATLAGNLCNAVPSADTAPAALVLDGAVSIAGLNASRQIPLSAFFTGPKKTVLNPGELVKEIRLTCPQGRAVSCYRKYGPRNAADLAYVGVAVLLALDEGGRISALRIALGAVAPTPVLVEGTQEFIGQPMGEQVITQCRRLAAAAARPITDFRASAEYRRALVDTETGRALGHCWSCLEG